MADETTLPPLPFAQSPAPRTVPTASFWRLFRFFADGFLLQSPPSFAVMSLVQRFANQAARSVGWESRQLRKRSKGSLIGRIRLHLRNPR
jgi:hypothetical protein